MRYEIATLRVPLGAMPNTIAGVGSYTSCGSAHGTLLGCWTAEIGTLNRFIWPCASIDARFKLRAEAVAKGIWPPKGAPEWLTGEMQSTIALPTAISPLA